MYGTYHRLTRLRVNFYSKCIWDLPDLPILTYILTQILTANLCMEYIVDLPRLTKTYRKFMYAVYSILTILTILTIHNNNNLLKRC